MKQKFFDRTNKKRKEYEHKTTDPVTGKPIGLTVIENATMEDIASMFVGGEIKFRITD